MIYEAAKTPSVTVSIDAIRIAGGGSGIGLLAVLAVFPPPSQGEGGS